MDNSYILYDKLLKRSTIKIAGINNNSMSLSIGYIILSILYTILLNGCILYYLYNLTLPSCNCIRDWRHNFMKNVAYFNIIMSFLSLIITNITENIILKLLLGLFTIVINTINLYAFYTYINDMTNNNCKCATEKQPQLTIILYERSIISIIIFIISTIYYLKLYFTNNI